jgi:TRAP-type mannitol/chloroaromatic compound transport system substrate-binding protein
MKDKKKKRGKVRKRTENRVSRRAFLTTAVATGAAAVVAGFPYIKTASAQSPVVLRVQSTWPARDIFHLSLLDLAQKVTDMGAGRLRFEVLPAGAVAPAFGVIDAVHRGVLDGGHGVPAYWFGKNVAASLFGTGPSFGMDAIDLLSWYYYGGGFQMYQDLLQRELRMNVVSFLYGPMPTQPLGWFRGPVENAEQLRGVRYRTVGLAAELFRELGASVVILPAGEIVPALERGVIDAAEFNNMTSDRLLGFPDVRKTLMVQSYHQPVEALELLINKARWDALPADVQAIVRNAVFAEGANFHYKMIDQNSKDMEEMVARQGVRLHTTPRDVLLAQLRAWDRIIARHSRANVLFARIIASQRAWARRVVRWKLRTYVENRTAFEHHFGRL